MPTSFETFINNELPLRVSTLDAPVSGDIPVFTGVGKLTEAKTASEAGLENQANKVNDLTLPDNTKYPTTLAVSTALSGKQAALASGTNIKTINGNNILGSGDLAVVEPSIELAASASSQQLSVGKKYYLPQSYIGAINLAAPTSAAIGDWFVVESRYSSGIDGTTGANLTGLNLTMATGEFVTGYGDIASPSPIPLLSVHNNSANSPNFTAGCSFKFTKVTATMWALQPTYGSWMPERFIMKKSGANLGGGTQFISTAATGTYANITLPSIDADLGNLSSVATTNSNVLGGTRCRILGGSNNNVSGTDNVAIDCTNSTLIGTGVTFMSIYNMGNIDFPVFPAGTTVLGSSLHPQIAIFGASRYCGALATTVGLCTSTLQANGTTYDITTDTAAPSRTNTPLLVSGYESGGTRISGLGSAVHDVDFIVIFGANSPIEPSRTFYAKRRVYAALHIVSGTPTWHTATEVVGTDTNLGTVVGTVTVGFTLDTTNNRLVPTVSATGGQTYQASVRVDSHYNRK